VPGGLLEAREDGGSPRVDSKSLAKGQGGGGRLPDTGEHRVESEGGGAMAEGV